MKLKKGSIALLTLAGMFYMSVQKACLLYTSGIEKRMLNFLENHDEQRIASDYFAGNGSKAIPAMIVSACMNTNPVMICLLYTSEI